MPCSVVVVEFLGCIHIATIRAGCLPGCNNRCESPQQSPDLFARYAGACPPCTRNDAAGDQAALQTACEADRIETVNDGRLSAACRAAKMAAIDDFEARERRARDEKSSAARRRLHEAFHWLVGYNRAGFLAHFGEDERTRNAAQSKVNWLLSGLPWGLFVLSDSSDFIDVDAEYPYYPASIRHVTSSRELSFRDARRRNKELPVRESNAARLLFRRRAMGERTRRGRRRAHVGPQAQPSPSPPSSSSSSVDHGGGGSSTTPGEQEAGPAAPRRAILLGAPARAQQTPRDEAEDPVCSFCRLRCPEARRRRDFERPG